MVFTRQSGFFFLFFRMYPSILSFEIINRLKLSFECGIPRPQDVAHLRFQLFLTLKSDPGQESNLELSTDYLLLQFFYPTIQCNCRLATCPRTQGYRKEPLFHTKRRSGRVSCSGVYVSREKHKCTLCI
jgi:hypothetical protein